MVTLLLVRHGEAAGNADGRFIGQLDAPLTDAGIDQAARLARRLQTEPLSAIVSSDLQRCIQTVEPTARCHGLEIQTDHRLREIANGAWSGLLPEEIGARWPDLFSRYQRGEDVARPEGETWATVTARVLAALAEIAAAAKPGTTLLIGTHAGPIAAATRRAVGSSTEGSVFSAGLGPVTNTGITTIRWPGPELVRFNDDDHVAAGPGSPRR